MSTICTTPIDCTNISPEAAFKKLIGVSVGGCPALRTIEVDAAGLDACDKYVTCANGTEETWKSIFFKMIAEVDVDCYALKIIKY